MKNIGTFTKIWTKLYDDDDDVLSWKKFSLFHYSYFSDFWRKCLQLIEFKNRLGLSLLVIKKEIWMDAGDSFVRIRKSLMKEFHPHSQLRNDNWYRRISQIFVELIWAASMTLTYHVSPGGTMTVGLSPDNENR